MDVVTPPREPVGVFQSLRALMDSQTHALEDERLPPTFVGELIIKDGYACFRSLDTDIVYRVIPVFRPNATGTPPVRTVAINALLQELTIEHRLTDGRNLSFSYARVEVSLPAADSSSQRRFLLIGKTTGDAACRVLKAFLESHSSSTSAHTSTLPPPPPGPSHATA